MKLTKQLRAEIRRAVIKASGIRNPIIELGSRPDANDHDTTNALNWARGADLQHTFDLRNETATDDHAAIPGAATFDCYVYSQGDYGQLECNCYVTLKDGTLADCHQEDLKADARTMAILGVPFSQGD